MSEEYAGMFWDCHAGNDYVGEIVQRPLVHRETVSAEDPSIRLAAAHDAGRCNGASCTLCRFERQDALDVKCPTCGRQAVRYAFPGRSRAYVSDYAGHVFPAGESKFSRS